MTEPDFWRTEIWHPLAVHLPLIALVVSAVSYAVSLFPLKTRQSWVFMAKVMLYVGTGAVWIAVFTGNLADGVVSRKICDPTVLKDHEISAYVSAILFSIGAALQITADIFGRLTKPLRPVILTAVIAGAIAIIYTGHMGATLVYQQAAGVYTPTEDCREFE